jgi:oxygen-dependent protoporphyrinogen oxidase
VSNRPRVAVIGGGVAGLTAAWRLEQPPADCVPADITVFEAAARFGGKIRTDRFDGFTVEAGPDSFLTSKPWALELVRALGIDSELQGIRRLKHRAMIRGPGGLQPLPAGLTGLVPNGAGALLRTGLLSTPGRIRAALDLVLPRGRSDRDESIASFVRRRFGRETWDRFMEPLLAGIHGGDGDVLSLPATFPALAEAERRSGSVIRGLRSMRAQGPGGARTASFVTFRAGMERLVEALLERLDSAELLLDSPVTSVSRHGGAWLVHLAGDAREYDAVVVSAPANAAARLFDESIPALAGLLGSIPFGSTIVVQTAFAADAVKGPLESGGYLNPRGSGRPVSACTFVSVKFEGRAPDGHVLLRTIPRFATRGEFDRMTDDRALELGLEELRDTLGVRDAPEWHRVYRYPDAMPQYTLGHLDRLRAIRRELDGLSGLALAGHSYDGVGIPDAVRSAESAVARVLGPTGIRAPAGR